MQNLLVTSWNVAAFDIGRNIFKVSSVIEINLMRMKNATPIPYLVFRTQHNPEQVHKNNRNDSCYAYAVTFQGEKNRFTSRRCRTS